MHLEALTPFGVRITGVDLRGPVPELVGLLAEHGVVHAPAQHIDDAAFLALLRSLGEPVFTVGETPVEGFPDLNVISNVGRSAPPVSNWHVDSSYWARPPAYTALRAVEIPSAGGQTLFSDQRRAYDTLPADLRDRLAGRSVTHVVTGLDLAEDEERAADHPVFAVHPVSGRTSVYLSSPKRCAAVDGLTADETRDVVARLLEHSTRPQNVLRHSWSAGDVVLWDNRCVLHRADHEGVVGDRVMHRGMVLA